MNSKLSSKIGSLFLCILLLQLISLTVFAATSLPAGLTGTGGTWNSENATYSVTATGTASGCNVSAAIGTKSMTLKNTSGSEAVLSFTYTENTGKDDKPEYSVSSDVAGDLSVTSGQPYSYNMAAGETLTFTVTTAKGGYTSSIVLSDISFEMVQMINIQLQTAANGSYTVTHNGKTESVTANKTVTVSNSEGATLVATPNSGYRFIGWRDVTTGKLLSNSTTYVEKNARTVKPDFISSSVTPAFQVKNGGAHYYLNDALAEAGNSGTIIVVADVTLPAGNYTIPSGVTLLIPYDSANTLVTNGNAVLDTYDTAVIARSEYRALTMESGAKITVENGGAISVSSGRANQFIGQVGPYGAIYMNSASNITIQSGGTLYAWGYIFHGTNGFGTVTVESGGTVYEPISIMDYPGSSSLTNTLNDNGVFPMRSYSIRNVEVPMTINSGAKEYVFCCLYGNNPLVGTNPLYTLLIANGTVNGETPVFQNAGTITKSYVDGRMCVVSNGNLTLNALTVKLAKSYAGTYTVSSSKTSGFYLPSCWDFTQASGKLTTNDNVIICEGCVFIINQFASADTNGKSVYVLDADNDPGAVVNTNGCSIDVQNVHGNYYTNVPTDAVLNINGTLIVSGGFYTSAAGACITSSEGGGQIQISGTPTSTTVKVKNTNAYTDVAIGAAKLLNSDGNYIQSATGTYTYTNGYWRCANHTYGDWEITKTPTCTATGIQTRTCTACGFAETQTVDPIEHTEAIRPAETPDCDTTGLTEGKYCSACGTTLVEQTVVAALGHKWDDGRVTTAATCGNSGLMRYTCTRDNCGHTKEEVIPATGNHTEEIIPGTDSTCTSTGLTEGKKCSICGLVTVAQEEVPMLDHTEETLAATDPTCTETGLTEGKKCSVCGTTIVPQEIIPALGHTEETIDGKKQTCTEDGLTEGKKCTVCGEITLAQERIPAAGHKWVAGKCTVCDTSSEGLCNHTEQDSVVTEPTCTAQGYTTHTCTACGYSYIDTYVDAMGHTPGAAATCTEAQTCTVCGAELAAAIGHNYSSAVTAPTCTESGYTTHTCQNCGHSYTDTTVEAKGHTPGEPTIVRTEPSCTEEGSVVTLTSCSICGVEVSRETTTLTALGHTEVIDPAVSSTCSAPGKTEGKHCSVCQEILIAQEEVPTLAHSYQSVVTEPTCTEGGYTTHTCANCGDSYVDTETEAVGHKYTSNVVAPTCSAVGYTEHICTQCGDSYRDSEVAASGHKYTASITPPTCSAAGYTTYTCAACGSSYTGNETAALGHEYVNGVCTRCGDEEKPVGVITPYQATLSLKSLVYMNIYSVIDGFDGIDLEKNMGLLVWTGEEADYTEELMVIGSDHVTAYNGAIQKGSYYYVQSGGITAKELGDEFHLRVYVKIAEDSYIYSKAITYGPQVYALNKLNAATSEDNSESLKKLVVSMLDYGAAAQLYFGYNTEDLANNIDQTYLDTYRTKYSASMLQAVTAADSSVVGDWSRDRVNCHNVIGSLILKGIITNNFSFKFTEEIMGNIDTAHCLFWDAATYAQLKADGASFSESNAMLNLELVKDPADGYLKAGYNKTAVKNLGDTLYVCAVVTTTDGSTYRSGIISYSGHAYIKNKVGATDEKLVDLVKCLTVYSDTAKMHFASQE